MSMRHISVEYNERPSSYFIYCRMCGARVARVSLSLHSFWLSANELVPTVFFNGSRNVAVAEDEQVIIDGNTLVEAKCVECRNLLGWKLIAASKQSWTQREGGFYLRLDKLINCNDGPLFDFPYGGDNEQNADQDGDANEQDLGSNGKNADQDGDANEQDLGSNGQNADQDGDANEQDLGSNVQNDDQDGDAKEEDGGCCRCLM